MPLNPFPALLAVQQRAYAPFLELCRSQLSTVDPTVLDAMTAEIGRQATINLVASESMPNPAVMGASGYLGYTQTVEGLPGHRWYPGSGGMDAIERATLERAKALFGFSAGNVQLHSATQANQAVYLSALTPGDTILAPAFTSGGHLSHGAATSLAHRLYKIATYSVPSFGEPLCLEQFRKRLRETGAVLVIAGASAYPREFPFAEMAAIAKGSGARLLADISHTAGLVAAGVHRPATAADFCTLSTHKTLCGPRAGIVLCQPEDQQRIDSAVFPTLQGAVFPHMMAAKAVCLAQAGTAAFRMLQAAIIENAKAIAAVFADRKIPMFTGGTDSHLLVIRKDLELDSRRDVARLESIGILTNPNYTHGDSLRRGLMSGIRIGTTWITQFGFQPRHTATLAGVLVDALCDDRAQDPALRLRLERIVDDVLASRTGSRP